MISLARMIELCGTASSYFADAKRAVRTWPGLAIWGQSLLIFTLFVAATLATNKVEYLFNFAVTDDLAGLLALAALAIIAPALAEEMDRPGDWEGVVLLRIRRGSPAHQLRFRPGDLVDAVDGKPVRDVRHLQALLARRSSEWSITYTREGRTRTTEFSR